MDTLKKVFASKLLDIKAIKLQPNDPFTGHQDGSRPSTATTVRPSRSPSCATL